ncbi:hypothetical protein [Pseudoalteromonas sp. MMG012]|uniref:hypothetical protein n=1 Tax=Pseudoalteromonas sp. MMG012 TaxID=2822686 RepID=UPI001B3A403D|nr:hypothetical protein [Pseudoalteromonas sp. MMG012]MBQ4851693.1 hypothetical protein [Pseudoalteromonas sp. MMG012]
MKRVNRLTTVKALITLTFNPPIMLSLEYVDVSDFTRHIQLLVAIDKAIVKPVIAIVMGALKLNAERCSEHSFAIKVISNKSYATSKKIAGKIGKEL